jgi:hypothetical protein
VGFCFFKKSYISAMISNTQPSTYGYAGDAYWPSAGTVPKSVAPAVNIEGTTYGIFGETVDSVFVKIQDDAFPGVTPVRAIELGLLAPGYFIYDPLNQTIGKVIKVDRERWKIDPRNLYVMLDSPAGILPLTKIEVCRSNAMSFSILNEGVAPVAINGVVVPQGGGLVSSGFAETGQRSRAVTPISYDSLGSTDLKISVNP